MKPVPPGVFIARRILDPQHMDTEEAARVIGLDYGVLVGILAQKLPVDAYSALQLAQYTGTSDRFWLNMQAAADRAVRRHM